MDNSTIKILVIDDDPDVLHATSRVLKKAGYQVITGSSGSQCIEYAGTDVPDLILLDMMLPDLNGIEVCRQIKSRENTAPVPVILISSFKTESDDQAIGLESGADDYIARPIANRELLARIHAFLRLHAAEKKLARQAEIEKSLRDQKRIFSVNNQIARVFLTSKADDVYADILDLVLSAFDCRYGFFGYINQNGDLNSPSITPDTWPSNHSGMAFKIWRQSDWKGIWAAAMAAKTALLSNRPVHGFDQRIVFDNALASPLLVNDTITGQIGLANGSKPFKDADRQQLAAICNFIAPILSMFIQREKSNVQLQLHAKKLEEKNIALNVLLETRDEGKKKIADTVLNNFDRLVFPYHEKIKHAASRKDIVTLLKIVEKNTVESLSPLHKSSPDLYRLFTPMEIQVADLIKIGKTSKEISAILNISDRSVFFHRNNIRKKLNIRNQKTNLRSCLLSH